MADFPDTASLFHFTDEHHALRSSVRKLASTAYGDTARARYAEDPQEDGRADWRRLATELGVLGLGIPENLGGTGGTLVDAAIAAEELGAVLATGPFFGTLYLALPLLTAAPPSPARDDLLARLCAGEDTAAVAAPGAGIIRAGAITAVEQDGRWLVTGSVGAVVDGCDADVLVVVAATAAGLPVVLAVTGTAAGVYRQALTTLDLTRRQAELRLDGAEATLIAIGDQATACLRDAQRAGSVLLAAEQVGASQRLLDVTVEHAKTRRQFGRPIGSFQAVKHRLADMLVAVEHARSAAYNGAWALAHGTDDAALAAAAAQAICTPAFSRVAADTIQLHGGIGFTWEHPAHHYFKRAATDAALLGGVESHRDLIASVVLDPASPQFSPPVARGRPTSTSPAVSPAGP